MKYSEIYSVYLSQDMTVSIGSQGPYFLPIQSQLGFLGALAPGLHSAGTASGWLA